MCTSLCGFIHKTEAMVFGANIKVLNEERPFQKKTHSFGSYLTFLTFALLPVATINPILQTNMVSITTQ